VLDICVALNGCSHQCDVFAQIIEKVSARGARAWIYFCSEVKWGSCCSVFLVL
jgi:hypothetical protein